MVRASKGTRHGSRDKLKKGLREKFKPETYIQGFKPGDKVIIKINQSSRKGMPHPRFKGKIGTVVERQGASYVISVIYGRAKKEIQTRPEHLKLLAK